MLIVGQVWSEEEREEVDFVAHVFAIEERFRHLAQKTKKKNR